MRTSKRERERERERERKRERKREKVMSGSFYKSCLLIQSHTFLHFFKGLKNFKFWSNKAAFGYFRDILMLEFTKINIKF